MSSDSVDSCADWCGKENGCKCHSNTDKCRLYRDCGGGSPPSPTPTPDSNAGGFEQIMLACHNIVRCMVGTPPTLTWDATLAAAAQAGAGQWSGGHAADSGIENMAESADPIQSCMMWYEEGAEYSRTKQIHGGTGHYINVINGGNGAIGCGTSGNVTLCRYKQAGQDLFKSSCDGKSQSVCEEEVGGGVKLGEVRFCGGS